MLTLEQIAFFESHRPFKAKRDASANEEFVRLARSRKWKIDGKTYLKKYHQFKTLSISTAVGDTNFQALRDDPNTTGGVSVPHHDSDIYSSPHSHPQTAYPHPSFQHELDHQLAQLSIDDGIKCNTDEYQDARATLAANAMHTALGTNSVTDALKIICEDLGLTPERDSNNARKKSGRPHASPPNGHHKSKKVLISRCRPSTPFTSTSYDYLRLQAFTSGCRTCVYDLQGVSQAHDEDWVVPEARREEERNLEAAVTLALGAVYRMGKGVACICLVSRTGLR